jgi:hypothetical protein
MNTSNTAYGVILSWDIGIRNLAVCKMTPHDKVLHWETIDIGLSPTDEPTGERRNKIDSKTSSRLFAHLMSRIECFDVADTIVLERQPPQNSLMRIIQGQIEMFFLCRGKKVEIFDGKSKISSPKMKNLSGNQKYRERKKEAIAQCREFLGRTGQVEWIEQVLDPSRKRDDLADCLIQAVRFREVRSEAKPNVRSRKGKATEESEQAPQTHSATG